jgi:acetolactate synthase-1/3 small subunit
MDDVQPYNRMALISTIVEHKPGVLFKVSNMFRRRGFNIESISVGPTEHPDLARMTIMIRGDEKIAGQVVKQLRKLVEVISVQILDEDQTVQRELALVKIRVENPDIRREIMDYTNIFRGRIVDVAPNSLIVEITGTPDKMDAFINLIRRFGILELSRTGITALSRGEATIIKTVRAI